MSQLDFSKWVNNRLANLVSFINVGTDLVGTNVQTAISELANRHFGKQYGYAESMTGVSTGSAIFVPALVVTLPNAPAGNYRAAYSFRITNSKSNTNGEAEITIDGTQVRLVSQEGTSINFVTAFKSNIVHAGGNLVVSLNVRRTAGNGLAIVDTAFLDAWRLS